MSLLKLLIQSAAEGFIILFQKSNLPEGVEVIVSKGAHHASHHLHIDFHTTSLLPEDEIYFLIDRLKRDLNANIKS